MKTRRQEEGTFLPKPDQFAFHPFFKGDEVEFLENGKVVKGKYIRHEKNKGIVVLVDTTIVGVLFESVQCVSHVGLNLTSITWRAQEEKL